MADTRSQEWLKTACILCHTNCGLAVQLDETGRRITRVKGDKEHPASKGYTCNKALQIDYYQNGRDRLTSPLRRKDDGTFEAIDWETAVKEVAEKFVAIRDAHGGDKILYYGGGAQGNHLPGMASMGFRQVLGNKYRSNALAQEKTGLAWVNDRMFGAYYHGNFEKCEVAVFVGKNPWHSHGIQRARLILKQLSKDESRTLIVIDPKRTETAELADIHLQVKPGTDAWALSAMIATMVQEDLINNEFLKDHAQNTAQALDLFHQIDVDEYSSIAGLDADLVREAARRMATASSMSLYEDLGVEMAPNSTLCSYLNGLLITVTGNFANEGGANIPSHMISLFSKTSETISENGEEADIRRTPVTGERILADLVPCNILPDEILTDHPDRFRAVLVEASNPLHSLADSPRMREAFDALELVVVVDVAMTETARHADYVLPACSQFEKAEATFFNFEFPENYFHLRRPLMKPLAGTLTEAEIHARLLEATGAICEDDFVDLAIAVKEDRENFAVTFMKAMQESPKVGAYPMYCLYKTLGPTLPAGLENAAGLWMTAHMCAMKYPESLARAGFTGETKMAGEELFDAIVGSPSGVIFTVDEAEESFNRIATPDGNIQMFIPEMARELQDLSEELLPKEHSEFPLVLEAGARRAYTAMTTIRDPAWLKSNDATALSISPLDGVDLGLEDGGSATLATKRGTQTVMVRFDDRMRKGHVSLPNGLGLTYPDLAGNIQVNGTPPNELTSSEDRDAFAGTPWHKFVPARLVAAGK